MSYPASKRVRLVWTENFVITESAASAGTFRYLRLNSVYDVDTALGSTTTPGFTEWSAFYGNYRVWSTAIRLEAIVAQGTGGYIATICLVPNSSQATLPSNPATWPVQPQAMHKTIVGYSSGGSNKVTFNRRYQIYKVCRVSKLQFQTDFDFTATTSSNPARQAYVAVTLQSSNSGAAAELVCQVYASMEIEFFNPIQLST